MDDDEFSISLSLQSRQSCVALSGCCVSPVILSDSIMTIGACVRALPPKDRVRVARSAHLPPPATLDRHTLRGAAILRNSARTHGLDLFSIGSDQNHSGAGKHNLGTMPSCNFSAKVKEGLFAFSFFSFHSTAHRGCFILFLFLFALGKHAVYHSLNFWLPSKVSRGKVKTEIASQ